MGGIFSSCIIQYPTQHVFYCEDCGYKVTSTTGRVHEDCNNKKYPVDSGCLLGKDELNGEDDVLFDVNGTKYINPLFSLE